MKEIKLTQGKVALVDDADFEMLNEHKWYARNNKSVSYATRKIRTETGKYGDVLMHRFIMRTPKGMDTDHVDGDGLNNQRSNLRVCTRSENLINRRKQKNNTSGYRGVSWHKLSKKWQSQIAIEGKQVNLGYFPSKEEAYEVYCEASNRHHGEYGSIV